MSDDIKKVEWPTGKEHISFSELSNWIACSYAHKLQHILKLGSDQTTPHLGFGKALHNANENFLKTRVMNKEDAFSLIRKDWDDNLELFKLGPFPEWAPNGYGDVDEWISMADTILDGVADFLEKQFPGWEYVSAEEFLYEEIKDKPVKFKGFIDGIIKVQKKGKTIYWIIDWKTCGWGWKIQKKRDFNVHLQLILYKHFWSLKHDILPKDIRCAFILLKRDAKSAKNALDIVTVSVGPKTTEKGLKIVNNHISAVKRNFAIKNRNSCTYCQFKGTVHCP